MGWFLSSLLFKNNSDFIFPKNVNESKKVLRKYDLWLPNHLLVLVPGLGASCLDLKLRTLPEELHPPSIPVLHLCY